MRRSVLLHSEYRLSTHTSTDCWLRLKKHPRQKGAEFQPLRKVVLKNAKEEGEGVEQKSEGLNSASTSPQRDTHGIEI